MNEVTKRFVHLFNEERDFFECHELFEQAWKASEDPVLAVFYKSLVQVATAQFKLKKGVLRGVRKLHQTAGPQLLTLPSVVEGIDIDRLRADFQNQVAGLPDKDKIEEESYGNYGVELLRILTHTHPL